MSLTPAVNRRRVPRRIFESPVGLLVEGKYWVERTYQVGEGGMLVSSTKALEVGRQLVVSFFLNHKTVIVRAVVRNKIPANGRQPECFGLEFVNLEFQFKREIRNFVASAGTVEGDL